jgi:hypothetical protein
MRTFIQLKNGIGFATIIVPTDSEPDHSVTPDDTTAVEVFTADPDQFLKKKYDEKTNSWSDAPILRYAEINESGDIIEIKRTVFEHEIDHNTKLMNDDTSPLHKWIDGEWVNTQPVIEEPTAEELERRIEEQNALIEEMRIKWEADPMSVDASWRAHFKI